jgi:phosphopantothenoylcysteine synthetase/decarboxylase
MTQCTDADWSARPPTLGRTPPRAVEDVKLLVAVCGGSAAIGVPHAILLARSVYGISQVRVVMTDMAQRIVGKIAFESATGAPVIGGWNELQPGAAPHIPLASWPDVLLVMPATANVLAKLAAGVADSLVTTLVLATEKPVVLAPEMNDVMWRKPAVQRNVRTLEQDGYLIVEPAAGISMATGKLENGSIPDIRRPIAAAIAAAIGSEEPMTKGAASAQ